MIIGEYTKDFCMQKVCFFDFLEKNELNNLTFFHLRTFAYLFTCKHVDSCLSLPH